MIGSKSDGIQHATIKKLKLFWNGNVVYDMAKLKPLRLVADVAMPEKKPEVAKTEFAAANNL